MRKPACQMFVALCLLAAPAGAQFIDGHIFVTDYNTNEVFEVDPLTGNWSVFADSADGISGPSAAGFTKDGLLLVSNHSGNTVIEFDAAGNGTVVLTSKDGLVGPWGENGIAIDASDRIYIANYGASQILRFDADYTNGMVFADSSDGIVKPDGLGFLPNGDLLVANRAGGGTVLLFDPAGNGTVFDTIAGEDVFSVAIRDNGDIYVSCSNGGVYRYLGGDVGQRTLFGVWGASNTGIRLSPDQKVLFHTSYGEGKLRAIDPDTAAEVTLVDAGWGSIGIAVVGSQFSPGAFIEFGQGLAGAGGLVPSLAGTGDPVIDGNITLECRDFVGGCNSLLLLGAERSDWNVLGGTLYVNLMGPVFLHALVMPGNPGVAGEGDLDLLYHIPKDPALVAQSFYFQQLGADRAAVAGVSMSNGLRLYIGE